MALNLANLAVVAQNGTDLPRIFIYKTPDALADVNTAGYFNGASKILRVLDVIKLFTSVDGTPVVSESYVNANASGVVDITDGAVLAATDTD
jgi:hypothetical protein